MNRGMDLFLEQDVRRESARWIYQAMTVLQSENKKETIQKLVEALEEMLEDKKTCYIQISLKRHKTLVKSGFYTLLAFDERFYLEKPLKEKPLEWDWMYEPYYEFCENIRESSKRYVGQIEKSEVSEICLLELMESKEIIRHLFREAAMAILGSEIFRECSSKQDIRIQLAEYMGEYEELLVVNEKTCETGRWISGILQNRAGEK